jgi:hypothetical protein
MTAMRPVTTLAGMLLALSLACSAPRSERCRDICDKEAMCAETLDRADFKFDKRECTEACTALERDDEGRVRVERHAKCVRNADCSQVYACE